MTHARALSYDDLTPEDWPYVADLFPTLPRDTTLAGNVRWIKLGSVAGMPKKQITAWPKTKGQDAPEVVIYATGLERWIEGRDAVLAMPFPPMNDKKYQPVQIDWPWERENRDDVYRALSDVAAALDGPHAIGDEGIERLGQLNRIYKRGNRAEIIGESKSFCLWVAGLPRRERPATIKPRRDLTRGQAMSVLADLEARGAANDVFPRVLSEIENGSFKKTKKQSAPSDLARWRIEKRDRAQRKRERLVGLRPERLLSIGGRVSTGEKRHGAEKDAA
jgi:hypothetical protein